MTFKSIFLRSLSLLALLGCGPGESTHPALAALRDLEIRAPEPVRRTRDLLRPEAALADGACARTWAEVSGLVELRRVGAAEPGARWRFARNETRFYRGEIGNAWEWLFRRNPVARERVSGCLVEHDQKILVEYPDAELEIAGLGRRWDRIAGLGITEADLRPLSASGKPQSVFGIVFERFEGRAGDGIEEAWWSHELQVPWKIRFRRDETLWELELLELEQAAPAELLADLVDRYPEYPQVDRADVADFEEVRGL